MNLQCRPSSSWIILMCFYGYFFFANHSTEKKDGVDVDLIMGRYNNIYNLIGGL
jgi:hypothetical protein